jgi:hypothetical protein
MNALAKLNFKTVTKSNTRDPVIARREKLITALKEQKLVYAAALEGKDHRIERHKWMTNEHGERVSVQTHRRVRPWFFEQDGGWYVQCRYGARVISVDGKNNAVFVTFRLMGLPEAIIVTVIETAIINQKRGQLLQHTLEKMERQRKLVAHNAEFFQKILQQAMGSNPAEALVSYSLYRIKLENQPAAPMFDLNVTSELTSIAYQEVIRW